jgi:hypothetical protein
MEVPVAAEGVVAEVEVQVPVTAKHRLVSKQFPVQKRLPSLHCPTRSPFLTALFSRWFCSSPSFPPTT